MESWAAANRWWALVIPTGLFVQNLDGTSIYLTMAAVFIAQATKQPYGYFPSDHPAVVLLLVSSKGAAGVTGSGFIVLAATISAVGHLPRGWPGADPRVSTALCPKPRALTNLVGNGVATVVGGEMGERTGGQTDWMTF